MRETAAPFAQSVLPRWECLGEPVATGGPLQRLRPVCGMGEQCTEVLPHERVQLLGGTRTGLTALVRLGGERLHGTATPRIARARLRRPRDAGGLTHATADSRAPQIAMCCVVACRPLFLTCKFGWDQIKPLLAHKCREAGHQCPPLWWRGGLAGRRFADGMGRGAPQASGSGAASMHREFACLGWIRQEPGEGGRPPAWLPTW
jgi:hypothetical protein